MDEPIIKNQSPLCPHCGGTATHRSRRRGLQEWALHHVLFKSPYRCQDCDERFFRSRFGHLPKTQLSIRKDTHPDPPRAEEEGSLPGFHHPV
jgi:hypothetical protein